MPDAQPLAERRTRALTELDRFLSVECRAVRLPEADVRAIPERHFIAGWQLAVQPVRETRRLNLYVDAIFPFSIPRFLLVDGPPFLTWPHIEKDGVLCLSDGALPLDSSRPAAIASDLLPMAYRLLTNCELGKNQEDFRAEFLSYWNWKISPGTVTLYSLLTPAGPSRRIHIWLGQGFAVAGENEATVLNWLRNFGGPQKQFDATEPSCLLWLEKPLIPEEYPDHSSDIWRMASSVLHGTDTLSSLASAEKRSWQVVLGAVSPNGPCLAAVRITRSSKTDVLGRSVDPINKGFRPGFVPQKLVAQRVFNSAEPVSRSKVERVDASWIHGRDHDPRQSTLRNSRVAIIGCGAIGAPVACQLAMAGVGDLLLIDPEPLTWSNVGRHPLGADAVGSEKACALAKKLQSSFPHSRFDSRTRTFGDVLLEEPDVLTKRDLLLCATGIWTVESSLNTWQQAQRAPRHAVYAWTEPHACAGHAVAITQASACLQCQFSAMGDSKLLVTHWLQDTERQEPACGAIYQPYGPVELSWTVALTSALALDCLLGRIPESTHRIWAGPGRLLAEAGGTWTKEWIDGKVEREAGAFQEERPCTKDVTCPICS
jgi:sulfur-carrier protein adenylyltransferase/sulfurtransferase